MSTVDASQAKAGHAEGHGVHIVPPKVLLSVFAALMVLTVATVAASYMDLGSAAIGVALGIALLKASLVALYFMHLRYDSPFYGMVLITALLFVILFISIALLDTTQYQPNLTPPAGLRSVVR